MDTGGVEEHQLRLGQVFDPQDAMPCGLRLGCHNGQFRPHDGVEQCRFANIGRTDNGHEARTPCSSIHHALILQQPVLPHLSRPPCARTYARIRYRTLLEYTTTSQSVPAIPRCARAPTLLSHGRRRGLVAGFLFVLMALSVASRAVWQSACAVSRRSTAPLGSFCASSARLCCNAVSALFRPPMAAVRSAVLTPAVLALPMAWRASLIHVTVHAMRVSASLAICTRSLRSASS